MKTPRLYLGTMTFGWSQTSSKVDVDVASQMLQKFQGNHIDTARIYAGGKTETILGQILDVGRSIGTKAHPSQPGGLSPQGIQDQLDASLSAMKLTKVDEYYLHQPDPDHSLEQSLEKLQDLLKQGQIQKIGLSNYHASEVARAFDLCAKNDWVAPSVYQGLYNPLNRAVEDELIPLLHQHGCSFVAYNPLAAGLLAGKHLSQTDVLPGRFRKNPNYLPRFYTDANFRAVQVIREACEKEGLTMIEATYRWLLCHSALTAKDGLLLGASSLAQLDENMAACGTGEPLPAAVVQAMDEAWAITKEQGVFPYWRSYSSDMPNRETLDQGASYEATKK